MPDANGNGKGQASPPALPVERFDPSKEEVKLPPTPEELHKMRLEKAAGESDDQRSERRAKELQMHHDAHMEIVADAHKMFPAPMHRNWDLFSDEDKKNWNLRRNAVDLSNKAYHLNVRKTFEAHQAEERHVQKALADKAAKAQENA